MATQAQTKANQANSKLSTGPRTPEGQARAAANSQTHGFCSSKPVIEPSQQAEFQALETNLRDDLNPRTPIEEAVFQTLLHANWNQLRLRLSWARFHATDPDLLDDPQAIKTYERLRRYTATVDRTFNKALKDLTSLQVARCQCCLATNEIDRAMPTLAASVLLAKNTKRTQSPVPATPTETDVPEYLAFAQDYFKNQAAELAAEISADSSIPQMPSELGR